MNTHCKHPPPSSSVGAPASTAQAVTSLPCVVGIGASAGGMAALQAFFRAMPPDSGIGFVVIQHLDPAHKSLTAELLSSATRMRVMEAEEGMGVEANHVYTLSPGAFLAIREGVLHLDSLPEQRRLRLPIDHFFSCLGLDRREKAIGIILSGAGGDGSQGIQSIAANGGIVLAQDLLSAQFDSMIQAAVATGLVRQTLPVEELPAAIIGYVQLLRSTPQEADALFKDMQTGVSEFFRDPEAWRKLESEAIAPLVEGKRNGEAIRAWVAGCAGEEAYSLAILLLEHLRRSGKSCLLQVFGTDSNEESIRTARAGRYPEMIEKQIPTELLERFFLPKDRVGSRFPERFLLVVFEDKPPSPSLDPREGRHSPLVRRLEEELRTIEAELQNTIQRLETSNEDLSLSNEEIVSINEELQSSNEELESSTEELQSLNEELSTVNQQLQGKVLELETANNDLKNLLASCELATLCLDLELCIKWFTPTLAGILQVIPADVGRPMSHLACGDAGQGLLDEARAVLQTLKPSQRELQTEGRRWYLRRLLPYRTDGVNVQGVTITFTDISESKRMAALAIEAKQALAETLEQRVRERTGQLRMMAIELGLAEERERRKLAEALHDDLGQALAIAKIKLVSLDAGGNAREVKRALGEIGDLIGQANETVRSLAFRMSPLVLFNLGLLPAIEWLADEMRTKYGLAVAIHDDGEPKPLSDATKTILFRALRELLVNAAKHSGILATEVSLQRREAALVVTVTDHGKGFDLEANSARAGFGLNSIRERIGYLGGSMHIESRIGGGAAITLTALLELDNPDAD